MDATGPVLSLVPTPLWINPAHAIGKAWLEPAIRIG
jgi:hypothetical protein